MNTSRPPRVGPPALAVAGSPLALAALFRSARGRIQGAVDRRSLSLWLRAPEARR